MADPRPASEKPIKTGLYKSPYELPGSVEQEVSYVADEILIKYMDTATATEIESFEIAQGLDKVSDDVNRLILYITPNDPIQMSQEFQNNSIIEFIEPNLIRSSMGSEVERTPTALESNLQSGALAGIAVVVGLFLLLRK
jgi:hypothetical protein